MEIVLLQIFDKSLFSKSKVKINQMMKIVDIFDRSLFSKLIKVNRMMKIEDVFDKNLFFKLININKLINKLINLNEDRRCFRQKFLLQIN